MIIQKYALLFFAEYYGFPRPKYFFAESLIF